MKKLLSLAAIFIGLNAYQMDIKNGWQLKGALEDINIINTFNKSDIISVWTYDDASKKWKVYLPNNLALMNNLPFNVLKLDHIKKGKGFWINANDSLTIETNNNPIYYNITENNLVDKPTIFSLSDIANKTFKFFFKGDFIEITFNSNGIANLIADNKNYEIKLENGIIKVYINNSLVREYKKIKADNNGIIVFGKNLENNEYFLKSWLTTINEINMNTLDYPFTVYEVGYSKVRKVTFENNKILFEGGGKLSSIIKDGKIIATTVSNKGKFGHIKAYKIQYIGKVDKYKILKIDTSWQKWKVDNSLVGSTFNDIIDSNQSVFDYVLHSDGTASYKDDTSINVTYQLINPTTINLTKCYSIDRCYKRDIIIDSNIGKITISGNYFSVATHSQSPIIHLNNYKTNNQLFNNHFFDFW